MSTDHIVQNSITQCMECKHCGESKAITMPAPIDAILGKMDAFMEAHKGCQPPVYKPPPEAVMSEYIAGFDAGCDYILREIELWQDEVGEDLHVLLAHLRMESKQGRENT
jgi:hypothetical protein